MYDLDPEWLEKLRRSDRKEVIRRFGVEPDPLLKLIENPTEEALADLIRSADLCVSRPESQK